MQPDPAAIAAMSAARNAGTEGLGGAGAKGKSTGVLKMFRMVSPPFETPSNFPNREPVAAQAFVEAIGFSFTFGYYVYEIS